MQQVEDEAFVLHHRPYTDSKLLVEWLCQEHGRVATVARTPSKRARGAFELFQQNFIVCKGLGELKTLVKSESVGLCASNMAADCVKYGLYINELLLRILAKEDPAPSVFSQYQETLAVMRKGIEARFEAEQMLRNFELNVLQALGYEIDFAHDSAGEAIVAEQYYHYQQHNGFAPCAGADENVAIAGSAIAAIGHRDFSERYSLRAAKVICRAALAPLLGEKPLKSRDLFR